MPVILTLGRWNQEDQEAKSALHRDTQAGLGYMRLCLKTTTTKNSDNLIKITCTYSLNIMRKEKNNCVIYNNCFKATISNGVW